MGRIAEEEREKLHVRLDKDLTKSNKYSILIAEILYPKAENTNVQMELKPLWFGLFLIL